jgi:hypothetical protein
MYSWYSLSTPGSITMYLGGRVRHERTAQ